MSSDRRLLLFLVAPLLIVGVMSWSLYLQPPLAVDFVQLDAFPETIGDWDSYEIPMEDGIARMLAADYNLQRVYVGRPERVVWLYIGYYGTERGGRPEHTPWLCYPSNGWEIVRDEIVRLDSTDAVRANELLVEKDGMRRLVHFWYQSHQRTGMVGPIEQALDRLWGRIVGGRADGALVRLSTPLEDDSDELAARALLISFGHEVAPKLRDRWPAEIASPVL